MSERSKALGRAMAEIAKVDALAKPAHPDIVQTMSQQAMAHALIAIADALETIVERGGA